MLVCRLQGLTYLLSVQTVMNVMSYDLSGVRIGHQTQLDKPTVSGQIVHRARPSSPRVQTRLKADGVTYVFQVGADAAAWSEPDPSPVREDLPKGFFMTRTP